MVRFAPVLPIQRVPGPTRRFMPNVRFSWIVLALVCPAFAAADPVSFTYQIDVKQRCTGGECVPISVTFPLTLTFDAGVTAERNEPTNIVRWYGAPTFSAVPLERPEISSDATPFATTVDSSLIVEPFDWRHVAEANTGAQLITPDFDYRWYLGISEAQDFFPSAPELSPSSFGRFLGMGENPLAFGFSFAVLDRLRPGVISPQSIGYSGTATLLDGQNPVPEPISIALVGSGLCTLGARAWRQRRGRRARAS